MRKTIERRKNIQINHANSYVPQKHKKNVETKIYLSRHYVTYHL